MFRESLTNKSDAELYGYFASFMVQKDALYSEIARSKDRATRNELDLADAAGNPCGDIVDVAGCEGWTGFLDLFEAELNRVSETIASQQESQELSAKAFLTNVDTIVKGKTTPETFQGLRAKAEEFADMCLKLQRFVQKNAEVFVEIATHADKQLGSSSLMILGRRLSASPWKEGPNSALVVVLSDIYDTIRKAETQDKKKDGKWVAPSSFERSTTKYWIKEDRLTDLLLAAVKEAPLLVYGRSGHLTTKAELTQSEGDKLWDSLATPISSVYFDSVNMSMYKERIKRSEGAQLFRVRWYGSKPSGDEPVFLELKTHHEKWINEKSVKERCIIREKDMRKFLSSKKWTRDVAQEIVLGGTPILKGEQLDKQIELCDTMHNLVISKDLRPCVRSMYTRAAFQSPDSNSLRLTLDRSVTLIDETRAPRGSWCLPDDGVISADMVSRVPYPVFEIKLSGSDMPATFQDLEAQGIMIEAPKFSKFLTGAASFNQKKIESLPYWFEDQAFEKVFKRNQKKEDGLGSSHHEKNATLKSMRRKINSRMIADTDQFDRVSQMFILSDEEAEELEKEIAKDATAQKNTAKPQEQAVPPASNAGPRNGLFRNRSANKSAKKSSGQQQIRPKRPARVEPKSYFANERTFIQWLSAALLLVTVSVILLDFQADTGVPTTAGIILNAVAVFVVFYSIFTYFKRLKMLQSGSPYGYVDHAGPIVLSLSVLLGVVMLLYYYVDYTQNQREIEDEISGRGPRIMQEAGSCFQRPIDGSINLLQYEPSDIAVDNSHDVLLVPSLQTITGLSISSPTSPVRVLATIEDGDLEGIVFVNDRIFALSESTERPILYELQWNKLTDTLDVINDWKLRFEDRITNGLAEGITYVPDLDGGSLLVSGDLYDPLAPVLEARGAIYLFDVPPVGDSEDKLIRKKRLNSNLINSGLKDSKIGAMQYFEGILYILNDNDRVIRSWNIKTGELLATIKLPRPPGEKEFSRQWEGLAFERRNNNNGRLGRNLQSSSGAASKSSLILNLALDTPPQVWSIAVDAQVGKPGSFIFPSCTAK